MNEAGVGDQAMAGAPPAGWFRDPLAPPTEPTRSRWWTGTRWVSRVRVTPAKRGLALDTPSPAGSVAEPPEGIAWIPWLDLLAPPPIPEIPEAPVTTTAPPFDADPMVGAFGRSDASAPVGVHWRSPEVDGGQVGGTRASPTLRPERRGIAVGSRRVRSRRRWCCWLAVRSRVPTS